MDDARTLLTRIPAIQGSCDLDLLVFFAKHQRTLLTSEHLARLLGYPLKGIAQSLDGRTSYETRSRRFSPGPASSRCEATQRSFVGRR